MTASKKLFELTQLAEASYANLALANSLENELKNTDFGMHFSNTQATEFAAHWLVVSHQANTSNGFSATLFEDKTASGNYTLAIRGTELPDGFVGDTADSHLLEKIKGTRLGVYKSEGGPVIQN